MREPKMLMLYMMLSMHTLDIFVIQIYAMSKMSISEFWDALGENSTNKHIVGLLHGLFHSLMIHIPLILFKYVWSSQYFSIGEAIPLDLSIGLHAILFWIIECLGEFGIGGFWAEQMGHIIRVIIIWKYFVV